jgi:hypothetical protein
MRQGSGEGCQRRRLPSFLWCHGEKDLFLRFLNFDVWQGGRLSGRPFFPAVFRKSNFYLNSLIWPSIRATNIKKNTQIKKWSFCKRIPVLVQRNHFSWEEKLVAPLIATPNVDRAIEDKKDGKKATLQATRVIHACRKESLFFFANKLDNVLVQITLVV